MLWFRRRKPEAPATLAPESGEQAQLARLTAQLDAVLEETERHVAAILKLCTVSPGGKP